MKVALGSDHGGFLLKEIMVRFLAEKGHQVLDLGAHTPDPSDYPDFARAVAAAILSKKAERGILLFPSGC
jgi:ribose 5-phosphate isomerase B